MSTCETSQLCSSPAGESSVFISVQMSKAERRRWSSFLSLSCYFWPHSPVKLATSPPYSCPPRAHCTVAPADLLSARCPTQVRDTVYWSRFCLYLIPLLFMVAESLASILPPPFSPPVQFPGDPHSFQGRPGWSSLRVGQVGNRQGYRLQPSSCTHTAHRAQTVTAHPLTSPVYLSQAHIDTLRCWCTLGRTHAHAHLLLHLTN